MIDGRLDDVAWSEAPVAQAFVQSTPRPAAPAILRSEARVLVDGEALYVALRYYDPEPAHILAPLPRRDDETTSDWAFVEIDSRHDRRTGFSFGVNPGGVQCDGLWLSDSQYDSSWNAVWQSAARVDEQGWTAEFRIPFSQLAFSLPREAAELVWGVNFYRYNPRRGESSNWSPRFPGLGGIVSNFNELRLPAPSRVNRREATPYAASTLRQPKGEGGEAGFRAGADFKVGVGPNFSLSATFLPDFGQVEADPSQVNLTAFELFQAERRPFFLEGLEVFRLNTSLAFATRGLSFADDAPFYSRRVGRAPAVGPPPGAAYSSPLEPTSILGAVKLSGQTPGGWTLGLLSAVTDREHASVVLAEGSRVDRPTAALSTTTVARARRSFRQGDSSLGLFLSDLHRFDSPPEVAAQAVDDARAVGLDVEHRFSGRRYELRSFFLGTRLTGEASAVQRVAEAPHHYLQRPDAPHRLLTLATRRLDGFASELRVSRIAGAFRWDLVGRALSPGYDANEIGFERNSDWLLLAGTWRYERFPSGRKIRSWAIGSSNLGLGWSFGGETRARVVDLYGTVDTRGYWTIKLAATRDFSALSADWLRGGPALLVPARTSLALSVVTDQRKASFATVDAVVRREDANGSRSLTLSPFLNVRSTNRLQWSLGSTWQTDTVAWQYVARVAGPGDVVGRLRQRTLSFTLRGDLGFSPRLVLQAFVQPFVTLGRYDDYQRLVAPRDPSPDRRFERLDPLAVGALPAPDVQQRTLNGSVILRWEYRPGSFLTAAWTHSRGTASSDAGTTSPGAALAKLLDDHSTNVVLVKIGLRLGS